ncbi:hypothetical protein [Devosia sp.]|uniref:hypothetical protein n=1 Tax=Devosia sp. TaxID=1871048 RepID=UPI00293172DD|nr:hypothetical protein [Devosia sp.]
MRTDLDLVTNPFDIAEITRADFVGYYHPREIVADPLLTIARKRALLARWLSDANALPDAPALRRSPAGVTATLDEIRLALDKLDEMVEAIVLAGGGQTSGIAA